MAATRKARVPIVEQVKLINECHKSGMSDVDWCRENGIAASTFYSWVSRCQKAAADQILEPNYGHLAVRQANPTARTMDAQTVNKVLRILKNQSL